MANYVADSKATADVTTDDIENVLDYDDAFATYDQASIRYDAPSPYTNDSIASGSYTDDAKPS